MGVVEDVPVLRIHSYADVWVPITLRSKDFKNNGMHGEYFATIKARKASDIPAIKEEYAQMMRQVPSSEPEGGESLYSFSDSILESFARTCWGKAAKTK